MKKYAWLFFCFYLKAGVAQQYIPFPVTDAVWREDGVNFSGLNSHQFYFYEISVSRDTVINALTYHELDLRGFGNDYLYFNGGWHGPFTIGVTTDFCFGAIREDSLKRIYYYPYYSGPEVLLYDFNLSVGDTFPETFINQFGGNIVSGTDSIEINGTYHKRLLITNPTMVNQPYASYIEGVGSTMGLLGGQLHITEPPFEIYSTLICFSENGNSTMIDSFSTQANCDLLNEIADVPGTDLILTLSPNPATSTFTIHASYELKNGEIEIFNLLGKKVGSKQWVTSKKEITIDISDLSSGLYFVKVQTEKGNSVQKLIIE